MQLDFLSTAEAASVPHIVVDGAPTATTVLTLSHWPGVAQPSGYGHDLSAGMAFHALDRPIGHEPAVGVTNNHFDQDGLVGIFALTQPNDALAHREVLLDLAAAGDFATFEHRSAARASMAIWTLANRSDIDLTADLDGLDDDERTAELYRRILPLIIDLVTSPERHRELWADDDAALDASERALRSGTIRLVEDSDLDLAVFTIGNEATTIGGHRFGAGDMRFDGAHPMALNNASRCLRQLVVDERDQSFRYIDRYESWVQLESRVAKPRVDLEPLALELSALDATPWTATAPSRLTPTLATQGSNLSPDAVRTALARHLRSAPPAWDPYPASPVTS